MGSSELFLGVCVTCLHAQRLPASFPASLIPTTAFLLVSEISVPFCPVRI